MDIAERCAYRIPVGQRTVPPRIADTGSAFAQLRELTLEGARWRYGAITPSCSDRLDLELGIIGQKGFADYFLVVRDIVRHAPTHCGRGSVANSVVSYCLGITHVDPIRCGLIFERFLNLERQDPPDIDLDFPWDERDKVLAYVFTSLPPAALGHGGQPQHLSGAWRAARGGQGARPAGGRDPGGHPADSFLL